MLPGDMSVSGSLRTMSVEDLLDWIDRRLISGTLTVDNGAVVRAFAFDSGYVVNAGSNSLHEQPENLLLEKGLVDENVLERAHSESLDTGTTVIEQLQTLAGIEEQALREVLEDYVSESLLDTLVWQSGNFAFQTTEEAEIISVFPISVRLRGCVVQGRQRAFRWRQIEELIPDTSAVLQILDRARLGAEGDSEALLQKILDDTRAIEDGATVEQLIERRHGRRFEVLDRLATLLERGGLGSGGEAPAAVAEEAPPEAAAAEDKNVDLERSARVQAEAGNLNEALALAEKALEAEPGHAGLQRLHRELERSVFAELAREFLTSFRVPKLLVGRGELDHLELSDTERYLAGRVDGRWDLLSLMRVAPMREVEVLIAFKRLADRGIISL